MTKIQSLPNLALPLQKMHLLDQLEKEIYRNYASEKPIGFAILSAIYDKEISANELFLYIKEQGSDNTAMMASVIGEDLLNKISKL